MYNVGNQSALDQLPYRSLSRVLLRTHLNTPAYMDVTKTLVRDLREINQKQQRFAMELSELILRRMTNGAGLAKHESSFPPDAIDHCFESAIACVREFGEKTSEAQVRALEALRAQSRRAPKPGEHLEGNIQAAA